MGYAGWTVITCLLYEKPYLGHIIILGLSLPACVSPRMIIPRYLIQDFPLIISDVRYKYGPTYAYKSVSKELDNTTFACYLSLVLCSMPVCIMSLAGSSCNRPALHVRAADTLCRQFALVKVHCIDGPPNRKFLAHPKSRHVCLRLRHPKGLTAGLMHHAVIQAGAILALVWMVFRHIWRARSYRHHVYLRGILECKAIRTPAGFTLVISRLRHNTSVNFWPLKKFSSILSTPAHMFFWTQSTTASNPLIHRWPPRSSTWHLTGSVAASPSAATPGALLLLPPHSPAPSPTARPQVPPLCRHPAGALLPGGAQLPCPLRHIQTPSSSCPIACHFMPGTALLPGPLEHLQMPSFCCVSAGIVIPAVAMLHRPVRHIQVPHLVCPRAGKVMKGAAVLRCPLQNCQKTPHARPHGRYPSPSRSRAPSPTGG